MFKQSTIPYLKGFSVRCSDNVQRKIIPAFKAGFDAFGEKTEGLDIKNAINCQRLVDVSFILGKHVNHAVGQFGLTYSETVSLVKTNCFKILKVVMSRPAHAEDEADITENSFKRALIEPTSVNPLTRLDHIQIPEGRKEFIGEEVIKRGLDALCNKFKINAIYRKEYSSRSNHACFERSREDGGYDACFTLFQGFVPNIGQIPESISGGWLHYKKLVTGLSNLLLGLVGNLPRNPRVFFLDIPERGDKHRIPGVGEFIFTFLSNILATTLKPVLAKLCPNTFGTTSYLMEGNLSKGFFNSTDATSSTDNPVWGVFRTILMYLTCKIKDITSQEIEKWRLYIFKLVGPTDIVVDVDELNNYREKFTTEQVENHTQLKSNMGEKQFQKVWKMLKPSIRSVEDQSKFFSRRTVPVWTEPKTDTLGLGMKVFKVKTKVNKSFMDLFNLLSYPVTSVRTSTRGMMMMYSLTSIALAFITNMPYALNGVNLPLVTTGDDAASFQFNEDTMKETSFWEAAIGYLVNLNKTIRSSYGYILGERVFKLVEGILKEIPHIKLKKFFPGKRSKRNAWINLPREFKKIYKKIDGQLAHRLFVFIFNSNRKKYTRLMKFGIPIDGPYGLFPKGYLPIIAPPYLEACYQGKQKLVKGIWTNQLARPALPKPLRENLYRSERPTWFVPWTPGVPDTFDWAMPKDIGEKELNALVTAKYWNPSREVHRSISIQAVTVEDVMLRFNKIKGREIGWFPSEDKTIHSSLLSRLDGNPAIPLHLRFTGDHIAGKIALIDYGNYRGNSKDKVEEVLPYLVDDSQFKGYDCVIIVHDAVYPKEMVYADLKNKRLIFRWCTRHINKEKKNRADKIIIKVAKTYDDVTVFTSDKRLVRTCQRYAEVRQHFRKYS